MKKELLDRFVDFRGPYPLMCRSEDGLGALAVTQVGDNEEALIGAERVIFNKKKNSQAKAFATGRHCVRILQQALELRELQLLPGEYGPEWPRGCVGSISHSRKLAVATILRGYLGVGVDIEEQRRMKLASIRRIATAQEKLKYSEVPDFDWTLLFSAKEAIFKAINPIVKVPFGFRDVEVAFDFRTRSFSTRYLGDFHEKKPFEDASGHWAKIAGHVVTVVTLK